MRAFDLLIARPSDRVVDLGQLRLGVFDGPLAFRSRYSRAAVLEGGSPPKTTSWNMS